jgi:hypothetical protein
MLGGKFVFFAGATLSYGCATARPDRGALRQKAVPACARLYINGEWVAPNSGETFPSYNPFVQEPWATISQGDSWRNARCLFEWLASAWCAATGHKLTSPAS